MRNGPEAPIRTWITAEWLDEFVTPRPAFEGILTGRWNGWAEWRTNRRVVEQIILLQIGTPSDLELDNWRFDGDILVVTAPDYPDEPTRIEPDEGLYDLSLGYVWTTWDEYNGHLDLSLHTLYRMEEK